MGKIDKTEVIDSGRRPWLDLENTLSGEDGESFARAIAEGRMSHALNADYDEATHSLRLLAPLEGFADREKVLVTVEHADARPWSDLRGLLSGKEGEEFARVIEEAFPTEPVKK
jgi:hypothetical protein